jgi:hypothetical protein
VSSHEPAVADWISLDKFGFAMLTYTTGVVSDVAERAESVSAAYVQITPSLFPTATWVGRTG